MIRCVCVRVCVSGNPDPGGPMSEVTEEAMEDEQQGASPEHNDAAPKKSPTKVSGKSKGQRSEVTAWAELAAVA